MKLLDALVRVLFTALWARHINRAGYTVRQVHSFTEATVWDGADERIVRFFMFGQRVAKQQAPQPDHEPEAGLPNAAAPAEYLWHDSRPPFPIALGASRVIPPTEPARTLQPPPGSPLDKSVLAD